MTKKILPTPNELRQLLTYQPETGDLFWKERPENMFGGGAYPPDRLAKSWNTKFAGKVAGSENGTGHLRLSVFGHRIVCHRVAWAMHYGEWPPSDREIDHVNLNGADNRIINLRIATRSQNGHNKTPPSSNVSGAKGVSWHKQGGKWQVKIGHLGKQYYLGLFDDFDVAVKVRREASERLVGDFSREYV